MENLEHGQLDLDGSVFRARTGDIRLTQTEVRLLRYLLKHEGQELSREQLHVDVWEFAPSVRSRSCDTAMRRLRAKIERDPAAPRHLVTVPNVGYRFVSLGSDRGSAPSTEADSDFIGHHEAVAETVAALASGGRVIAVTGPPGVGKSRVALEAARRAAGPPMLLVDCSPLLDPEQLVCAIADRLELPPEDARGAAIARVLGLAPMTLVLDDAEHLLDGLAGWIRWADAARQSRILITSRTRPPPGAATEVRVAPLSVSEAIALFARRTDSPVAAADEETIRQLVASCDCLPLAIELAAARARLMSPADLLRRLSQSLTMLRDRARPPRHATLEATLRVSWQLLSPAEQLGLGQATVFVGGFDLGAAEAVVDLGAADPLDVFEALADHSLLRLQTTRSGTRITLSETVRAFASERAAESTMSGALQRHARYYAAMGPADPDGDWRIKIPKADVPNALEATRALLVTHRWELAARAWLAAWSHRVGHAPSSQILALAEQLLGGDLPAAWAARVELTRGLLLRDLRQLGSSTTALERATALAIQERMPATRDRAELGLACVERGQSRVAEARDRLD